MRSLSARASDRPLQDAKAGKAAQNPGKQPRTMRRRSQRRRIGGWVVLGVALSIIVTTVFGVRQGWHAQAFAALGRGVNDVYRATGLTVTEVTLSGRTHTGSPALRRALGVEVGDPILNLDLDDLQDRLQGIGWVASAEVQRHLPDRLHITIVEREPFARWQRDGRTALIDRAGAVILTDVGHRFRRLPRVIGPGANERAAELLDLLDQSPRLARQVRSASLVRQRRWDVTLDSGITVSLPEQHPDVAWQHLDDPKHRRHLLGKDVGFVDMRIPGRVIVRGKDARVGDTPQEQET
ncbi:MAG: FtsQ-type POTRA domain-containing protein [Minwuia sp.]|nr:FtsQ-type POTRA domain-containing protein [Minwuia sp.]